MTNVNIPYLAEQMRYRQNITPEPHLLKKLRHCTEQQFRKIPIPVTFVDFDPYSSLDEMVADIDRGRFLVRGDYQGSVLWGPTYGKFRAVHDYFDHYLPKNPFTMTGEAKAFGIAATRFPHDLWPCIFNELVLANAYKVHYGESVGEKFVTL